MFVGGGGGSEKIGFGLWSRLSMAIGRRKSRILINLSPKPPPNFRQMLSICTDIYLCAI